MQINITIEPEYSGTVWCKETMDGINEKVSSLRYSVNFCSDVSEAKDEIIIIGTSPDYVIKKIDEAAEKKHSAHHRRLPSRRNGQPCKLCYNQLR